MQFGGTMQQSGIFAMYLFGHFVRSLTAMWSSVVFLSFTEQEVSLLGLNGS